MSASANFAKARFEVEAALARRIPSALSPRALTIRERMTCGVEVLDGILDGGLPVGAITEFVGVTGSGRTTAALAFAAAAARDARVAAWIDVGDGLDPSSAALNGVELARLLWVRCSQGMGGTDVASTIPAVSPIAGMVAATEPRPASVRGCGGLHPRNESHGMPEAIRAMLQAHGGLHDHQQRREKKMAGTPGAPNRPLPRMPDRAVDREEQVPTDRLPSRRAQAAGGRPGERRMDVQAMEAAQGGPRCAEPQLHRRKDPQTAAGKVAATQAARTAVLALPAEVQPKLQRSGPKRSWTALDHALRATDLLLQAGGFGLIVLDLGDTPAEMSWRIPLATWFRYRAGCERSRTSLLVLTQHPCARSSAELVVRMEPGAMEAEGNVLTGLRFRAEIERQRFQQAVSKAIPLRKPPQRAGTKERTGTWRGRAAWAV